MARKSLKPCKEFGCNNLTRKSYCKTHEKNAQEMASNYNRYKRDPMIDAFYRSVEWLRVKAAALARDKHLCQWCLKRGVIKSAQVVHHLVEVKTDWSLRLTLQNLESVCHACHNRHHKRVPPG